MGTDVLPPRPRLLPIAPVADPPRRHLPLMSEVRDVDREHRPVYAVWELTLRCDLACRHCGSRAGRARPNELTKDQAIDLVHQIADMGVTEVSLIGGEAYLHDAWTDVAKAIHDRGMVCTIVTGARGIDHDIVEKMQQCHIRDVSVSIDGLASLHDQLRGVRGSFAQAIHALQLMEQAEINVAVNTQITRPALRQIEPLIDYLIDHTAIHAWQVQLTVPMGRAADEPELLLQPYQVLEVMPMLARIAEKFRPYGIALSPGNDIGYYGPYEEMLRGREGTNFRGSCQAGRMTLGIEADGSIKGCPSLPTKDYVGGNILDNSLKDVWERATALRFTRDRTVNELWGYCRDCYYAEDCMGGCSWTAHVLFGRIGNNPYCHHRALELLRQNKRERIRQVKAADGKPFDYGLFELTMEDWPEDELNRVQTIVKTEQGFLLETENEPQL